MDPHLGALAEKMKTVSYFKQLSKKDLLNVLENGSLISAEADEVLFHEDEPSAGLYVLLKGQAHLKKFGPDGKQNIVHVIEPVFIFNEVSVADKGLNPVTAVAFKASLFWKISAERYHKLTQTFPELAFALLEILAQHNRLLLSEYEDMCFLPVRARLAKFLLETSANGQKKIDRSQISIQFMSERISTAPELVSRAIGFMRNNGYIDASRGDIVVKSSQALEQIASLSSQLK